MTLQHLFVIDGIDYNPSKLNMGQLALLIHKLNNEDVTNYPEVVAALASMDAFAWVAINWVLRGANEDIPMGKLPNPTVDQVMAMLPAFKQLVDSMGKALSNAIPSESDT